MLTIVYYQKKILSSYELKDSLVKRELLITPFIIRIICKILKSNRDIFISLLITRVFFFEIFSSKDIKISGELYSDIITIDRIFFYEL